MKDFQQTNENPESDAVVDVQLLRLRQQGEEGTQAIQELKTCHKNIRSHLDAQTAKLTQQEMRLDGQLVELRMLQDNVEEIVRKQMKEMDAPPLEEKLVMAKSSHGGEHMRHRFF